MDYCACGRRADGRCAGCSEPTCRSCSGTIHAAKTAITARLGLATRPAVLCGPCETRELADLRATTGERVRAAIGAAAPIQAKLLALSSYVAAGGPKPSLETAHWPTFDALKVEAKLAEANAYREMLALVRAGDVALRIGRIHVFVDARVKHLTGFRRDSHDVGQVEAKILRVNLTGGEQPVLVEVALRPDGSLLKAPEEVRADLYRVRISQGDALDPFPIPMDKYPWECVKAAEMRRRLARLRADLDHIERAAPGTNEFDAMVRGQQPAVDVEYAEHQMFRALWASIDGECTAASSL